MADNDLIVYLHKGKGAEFSLCHCMAHIERNLSQCAPCFHCNNSQFKSHFALEKILIATKYTSMGIDSLGLST